MDIASAVLIALGAILGVLMLINLLKGHHIPKALTLIHGGLVVTGLVLLILFNISYPAKANWISVGFFVLAAMGGVYILLHDIKHEKVPLPVIFAHGAVAVTGFIVLLCKIKQFHSSI
jgi:predicted membrane channel-forming protein YqfA (hemolysin III family)